MARWRLYYMEAAKQHQIVGLLKACGELPPQLNFGLWIHCCLMTKSHTKATNPVACKRKGRQLLTTVTVRSSWSRFGD